MSFQTHLWIADFACQQSWRGTNVLGGAGRGTHVVSPSCSPATIRPGAAVSPLRQEAGHDD